MSTLAEPRRLAQLPGYDTSPDVYETPSSQLQSTDDSAITPSTSLSQDDSSTTDDSDASSASSQLGGVSRRRLYPSQARQRFSSTSVRARNVDLSDRVDGRRQGYRVRLRTGQDGEDESLEARIARLKREVEECRIEASRRKEHADAGGAPDAVDDSMSALGRVLASLDLTPSPPISSVPQSQIQPQQHPQPGSSTTPAPEHSDLSTHLPKLAAFDTRLAALESTLGLTSLSDAPAASTPLLPTLALLDSQLSALSSASSLAHLESLSARISSLRSEARALTQTYPTRAPRPPTSSSVHEPEDDENGHDEDEEAEEAETQFSSEEYTKLNELFALLPTLSSLAPTVPALLARLRSLRVLHGAAAGAAADLEALETRQGQMEAGLKSWREGLERVEEAVEEANAGNGKNGRMVKGWVDDLEGRVRGLQ